MLLTDSRQNFGWKHWIPTRPIFEWGMLVNGAIWQWGELTEMIHITDNRSAYMMQQITCTPPVNCWRTNFQQFQ